MRAREGMSLVELLAAVVIGAMVVMAIFRGMDFQQRANRQLGAEIGVQDASRVTLAVLVGELREVSASGGDLVLADSDSLTVRAFRKIGIVCNPDGPGKKVDIWELGDAFSSGDSLLIFADNDTLTTTDDTWSRLRISSAQAATCSGGFGSDAARRINLGSADSLKVYKIHRGAPVRAFTHLTYGLFEIDGQWVLGRRSPGGAAVALLGPLAPASEGGLRLRYFDIDGAELTPQTAAERQSVARIEVRVLARSPDVVGGAGGVFHDSLVTQLYLRNN